MNWQWLDAFLTRLRPHRERLALLLDLAVVALAWQGTYLFRLGFERWFSARPGYDALVLAGLLVVYGALFALLRVPPDMPGAERLPPLQAKAAQVLLATNTP